MSAKYLYLVRHGQYHIDKESPLYGRLTELGVYQASCIAERLCDYPVQQIYSSSMLRAQETASIIGEKFLHINKESHRLLREGLPYVPAHLIKLKNLDKLQIKSDRQRMEQAFEIFFCKNYKEIEKHELLICHGNIIRFFVCKSLGVPIEAWANFEILEGSLSVIKIMPNGSHIVKSVGECGHIPLDKRTII